MKITKYLFAIIVFQLIAQLVYSQTKCTEELNQDYIIEVESREIRQPRERFTVNIDLISKRDQLFEGAMFIEDNPFFQIIASPQNPGNENVLKDQKLSFSFEFRYDFYNVPYSYQELNIILEYNDIATNSIQKETTNLYIYFTTYASVEIWDYTDFDNLKRFWINKPDEKSDGRILLPPDLIPRSDIDYSDPNLTDEDINMVFTAGLAYAVPKLKYIEDDEDYKKPKRTFRGRIENVRVYSWFDNDNSVAHRIWLKNATIKIMRDRWAFDTELASVKTDDEGYIVTNSGSRTVNFTHEARQYDIDIYIEIILKTPDGNLVVRKAGQILPVIQVTSTLELSPSSGSNDYHVLNFGNIEMGQHHGGKQFTWTAWAWEAVNDELATGDEIHKKLKIIIRDCNTCPSYYNPVTNNIRISQRRINNERTMWHEFGHMVHQKLAGIPLLSGGSHSWSYNNKRPQQAFSEGFANGISFIMDEMFYFLDEESGRTRQNSSWISHDTYAPNVNPLTNVHHPYVSEVMFGATLLDMWDGPNNYISYGYPVNTGPNNAALYGDFGIDNYELTLNKILKPFWDGTEMKNVEDYFYAMLNADCNDAESFTTILRLNNYVNTTGYHSLIGTDGIELLTRVVSHIRYKLNNNDDWVYNKNYDYYYKHHDIDILDDVNLSFNLGEPTNYTQWYWPIPLYKLSRVSDNVTISNGAILSFNKNLRTFKTYDPIITNSLDWIALDLGVPLNYSDDFTICGHAIVTVETDGIFEVGNTGAIKVANVVVENRSAIVNLEGNLIINDGSRLTISEGASLVIGSNSELNIMGTGQLIIEDGGFFCFENGADITLEATESVIILNDLANTGVNPNIFINSNPACLSDPGNIVFTGNGEITYECAAYVAGVHKDDVIFEGENKLWNTPQYFNGSLIVGNGATVTVQNTTLEFSENSSISVETGGRLVLNNVVLSNLSACSGNWIGIDINGAGQNGGIVEIRNGSTVENTTNGINVKGSLHLYSALNNYSIINTSSTGQVAIMNNITLRDGDQLDITAELRVKNSARLILTTGCLVNLTGNGRLIIDPGSSVSLLKFRTS